TGTRLAISHQKRSPPLFELSVVGRDSVEGRLAVRIDEAAGVIALNANATRVAVTGGVDGDTAAGVHDLATGNRVFAFDPPGTVSRCVLFLPDDRLVVANGRYVYVLPADGGEPLFTLAGHPKQV